MATLEVLIALDAVSALLALSVAGYFLRLRGMTGSALHLLYALGLALLGLSFLTAGPSAFDLGGSPGIWDGLRISGQLGGALVILIAHAGARSARRPGPFLVIGYALVALSILFGFLYVVVPPTLGTPPRRIDFIFAHAAMAIVWLASAALVFTASRPDSRRDSLLVPAAFLAFAASKYTWLLVDVSEDKLLVPFVYPWRFVGLLLLLAAVALPARKEVRAA